MASEERFRRVPTYQNESPNLLNGLPDFGAWNVGDFWRDQNLAEFVCTLDGTPGIWRQIRPATVATDPASGTFPTGYRIMNVCGCGSEAARRGAVVGGSGRAGPPSKVGFHGAEPTAQRANTNQAEATGPSPSC
jgi:hypothetical protein